MNSRERILKAFDHEEPDRVPTFCQTMMQKFERQLEQRFENDIQDKDILFFGKNFTMFKKLGFDSAWGGVRLDISIPSEVFKEHPLPQLDDKSLHVDIHGRIIKVADMGGVPHSWYYGPFLTSVEQASEWYENYFECNYNKPEHDKIDEINKFIDMVIGDGNFVPTCGVDAIFEPVFEGLGPKLFSRLLIKDKNKLKKFFDSLGKKAVENARIAAELNYDVYNICDDSAYKNRPFINPKHHEELIIPWYKKIVNEIHKKGKFIFFHSDGFTEPYFPGLIKAGFDGVESLEPAAGMDLKHLKEEYGDKLCLMGNIDCSRLLPMGSKEDVKASVKKCIKDAAAGGGYILAPCTDLTDSCKVENVIAMVDAVEKYGQYPINF
ncbi:MAG: uroporphyrinogen decarboxylase family protein [Promethearchaeota archaeon]